MRSKASCVTKSEDMVSLHTYVSSLYSGSFSSGMICGPVSIRMCLAVDMRFLTSSMLQLWTKLSDEWIYLIVAKKLAELPGLVITRDFQYRY